MIVLQGGSAEIELKKGQKIRLSTDEKYFDIGDDKCIYVDYKNITKVLPVGGKVFIDDGLISVIAEKVGKRQRVIMAAIDLPIILPGYRI